MGQAQDACSTTNAQSMDCAKGQERNVLPWARSEWQGDRPAAQLPVEEPGNRYTTAQGEDVAARRVEPDRVGASIQHAMPPFRAPLDNAQSLSGSPAPGSSSRGGHHASSGTSLALHREDPEVRQDDWEALNPAPEPANSGRQQRERQHVDRHIGRDEELENRAKAEEAKQCYFDLELGEAGPASVGHDLSSGRERKWHRFRSGATYDGEWLGGIRDGVGKQCWPDGTVYVGEWKRGRAGGRGEIRHYDGDIYTGEWINGRAHGSGVFRHQGSHAIYEGEFRCDMREGMGVELWVDGSWYAGEFRKGAKHGHGEHRWPMPSGTYYVGSWRANELAGPGRYFVKDGPSYQGQWMNSVIDGSGVYTWVDGQQFEGQYQLDRKHGFGILTTPDGESKEGFWDLGNKSKHDPNEKST